MNEPMNPGLSALFDPEVDPATGASIYRRSRMASLLKISERQLDRLVLAGKIPVRADGMFFVRQAIDAFAEYSAEKGTNQNPAQERIAGQKIKQIDKRIARENLDLIEMVDATETIDMTTRAFNRAVDLLELEITRTDPEPDHVLKVVRPVFGRLREKLADDFSFHRAALIKGPKRKGARHED